MITKMRGFTLIETLLALAILAVLSAAAVMVLQNVIRADGLTREKSLQIAALQRAFRQIADDVTHIIPRRARNSDTFFFAGRFQLQSDDWGLAFSRSGWPNPLGILPRSEIQNVSYRLRQQQLERLSFDQQDPLTGSQPTVRVLLREVRVSPAVLRRRALAGNPGPPAEAAAGAGDHPDAGEQRGDNPPVFTHPGRRPVINRQRGVALLMVLFILALMMILASAMTERTAVMYQHTAVTLDNLQARWYALAAENMAAALLQRDALDSPSQTNLAQTWAQEGRRFTLDDGEIRATIRDGHACFNLNAINHRTDEAGDGTPYPTDVFVRLLALLGEPPLRASQIAAALGDWTDSDGQQRLNGAEDEVYMAQTPGYLAANQPMQDVSELRLLAGMDAALYQRLLPFVCVQPDDALQVNVNTLRPSQAALLVALFPGDLTLQEAQQLLHNRPRTGWSSVAAFLAQPTLQKTDTTLARPWLTVHSARFIAAFTLVTGNLRFQLHSVLQQEGRTFTVVQRRYGLSMVVDEQD